MIRFHTNDYTTSYRLQLDTVVYIATLTIDGIVTITKSADEERKAWANGRKQDASSQIAEISITSTVLRLRIQLLALLLHQLYQRQRVCQQRVQILHQRRLSEGRK